MSNNKMSIHLFINPPRFCKRPLLPLRESWFNIFYTIWLVGLTAKVISWRSVTHMCFLTFLTPILTQLFFPRPPTTFLTFFCRGERRKHAGKKNRFNQGSNSQPPGHESDTLITEPPRQGIFYTKNTVQYGLYGNAPKYIRLSISIGQKCGIVYSDMWGVIFL